MTTHTVHATITVEVNNGSVLAAIAGDQGDERARVERALQTGLRELPAIGQRYGFKVVDSDVAID